VNEQELIESGKLELYVAGVLCGQEALAIADQISNSRSLQAEVRAIESAMLAALNEGHLEPGIQLRTKILNDIENQNNLNLAPSESKDDSKSDKSRVVRLNTSVWFSAAASILLLIASAISLYKQNEKIKEQNKLLSSLNLQYNQKLAALTGDSAALAKLADQLALINHHFTKKIVLSGETNSPESRAIVYWNTFNSRVIVNPNNLPKPPANKEYQVWALNEGKYVSAGVFEATNDTIKLREVKNIASAQAFMITIEPKNGVNQPTLSATLVKGRI